MLLVRHPAALVVVCQFCEDHQLVLQLVVEGRHTVLGSLYPTLSFGLSLPPEQNDVFHSQWPAFQLYDQREEREGPERMWMELPIEWVCT